jgi:hypothetical protein
MVLAGFRFGVPDLELGCSSGTRINPSSFVGHELIALFCPLDEAAAQTEMAAYRARGAEFLDHDAWLLTFADHCGAIAVDGAARLLTIPDGDRRGWVAFRNLAAHPEELDRSSGATFMFTRGGSLHRLWQGSGHVEEVLAELRAPSFEDHLEPLAG